MRRPFLDIGTLGTGVRFYKLGLLLNVIPFLAQMRTWIIFFGLSCSVANVEILKLIQSAISPAILLNRDMLLKTKYVHRLVKHISQNIFFMYSGILASYECLFSRTWAWTYSYTNSCAAPPYSCKQLFDVHSTTRLCTKTNTTCHFPIITMQCL